MATHIGRSARYGSGKRYSGKRYSGKRYSGKRPVEQALGLVFGGEVLDVIVLGDGRGNGDDQNLETFGEIARRAQETIRLTPESRYSWGLGGCDLPDHAEYCSRVTRCRA